MKFKKEIVVYKFDLEKFRQLRKEIGIRIKIRRKQQSFVQADLADMAKCSRPSIVNIEQGRQEITVRMLYKLSLALGCQPSDLLPKIEG